MQRRVRCGRPDDETTAVLHRRVQSTQRVSGCARACPGEAPVLPPAAVGARSRCRGGQKGTRRSSAGNGARGGIDGSEAAAGNTSGAARMVDGLLSAEPCFEAQLHSTGMRRQTYAHRSRICLRTCGPTLQKQTIPRAELLSRAVSAAAVSSRRRALSVCCARVVFLLSSRCLPSSPSLLRAMLTTVPCMRRATTTAPVHSARLPHESRHHRSPHTCARCVCDTQRRASS